MNSNQEKFIEKNAWVLKHPDAKKLKPIIQSSPLAIALEVWESVSDDGSTLQELSHRLDANTNTIAIVTRAMERAGLVRRSRNPENARQTLIERID